MLLVHIIIDTRTEGGLWICISVPETSVNNNQWIKGSFKSIALPPPTTIDSEITAQGIMTYCKIFVGNRWVLNLLMSTACELHTRSVQQRFRSSQILGQILSWGKSLWLHEASAATPVHNSWGSSLLNLNTEHCGKISLFCLLNCNLKSRSSKMIGSDVPLAHLGPIWDSMQA